MFFATFYYAVMFYIGLTAIAMIFYFCERTVPMQGSAPPPGLSVPILHFYILVHAGDIYVWQSDYLRSPA